MSFNTITHPTTGVRYSIFSNPGRELLKSYLNTYKSGGMVSFRIKLSDEACKTATFSKYPNHFDETDDKAK